METNSTPERELTDVELMQMKDDELITHVKQIIDNPHYHNVKVTRLLLTEAASRYANQHGELVIRGNLLNRVRDLAQGYGCESNGWIDSIRYVGLKLGLLHRMLTFAAQSLKDDEELK